MKKTVAAYMQIIKKRHLLKLVKRGDRSKIPKPFQSEGAWMPLILTTQYTCSLLNFVLHFKVLPKNILLFCALTKDTTEVQRIFTL